MHLNSKAEHKAMETEALTAVGAELLRAGRIPIGKEIPHTQKKICGTHQSSLWQHFLGPSKRHEANSRRHHRDLGEIKLYWALQCPVQIQMQIQPYMKQLKQSFCVCSFCMRDADVWS